jgi:hypothetical protein
LDDERKRSGKAAEDKLPLPQIGKWSRDPGAVVIFQEEGFMRRPMARWTVLFIVVIFGSLLVMEGFAQAQCPPGTHWSNRVWSCVRNGPPMPPPPPPPPPRRCDHQYRECTAWCNGWRDCLRNCDHRYRECMSYRRGY